MQIRNDWMTNNNLFGDDYIKQLQIQEAKERFDIQRYQSNEGRDALIDGIEYRVAVQPHTNITLPNKDNTKLHVPMECDIKVGSIVIIDGVTYIVNYDVKNNGAYKSTEMLESNNTLRFYNKTTFSLVEVPCIFTGLSMLLKQQPFLNVSAGNYSVTIPSGYIAKNTENLNRRYLISGSAYKTKGIDDSTNGLTKIELIDDSIIPDDNQILGIADYFSSLPKYDVAILNGSEVTVDATQSSSLQLNVQCKLNDIIVDNPIVTYSSSDVACCTISNTGLITVTGTGSSIITATYGTSSDTINVTALMSVPDNFQIKITPTDTEMYIGKTKTFTANVTNNGIDAPFYGITWIISNVDESTNEYCTYVVNGRDITITTKNQINKSINIKATLDINQSVFADRIITIKSLV